MSEEKLQEELGIGVGETTADGLFTIECCRCVGACGLAPVMTINDKVHGHLVPEDIPALIICVNLVMAEAVITEQADATGLRFVLVSLFTFFLMTLMVIAGIWFPAAQAMRVKPADALHDE